MCPFSKKLLDLQEVAKWQVCSHDQPKKPNNRPFHWANLFLSDKQQPAALRREGTKDCPCVGLALPPFCLSCEGRWAGQPQALRGLGFQNSSSGQRPWQVSRPLERHGKGWFN